MSSPMVVQACPAANFDAATGTCSAPIWLAYEPSPFPALTLEEGAYIGGLIVMAWAAGYGMKAIRKALG